MSLLSTSPRLRPWRNQWDYEKLKPSSQYKKDYKRFRNNPGKVEVLSEILKKLANEEPIPEKHNPHMLTGNYKGYMESI